MNEKHLRDTPFDSIESTHEYLRLLDNVLLDVQETAQRDLEEIAFADGVEDRSRSFEVMRLVSYKLDQLRHHVKASSRIVNDLRTLRRLLSGERSQGKAAETADLSLSTSRARP